MCLDLPLRDCWTAEYDILFVFDCRNEIAFQYRIFSLIKNHFSTYSGNIFSLVTYEMFGHRVINISDEMFSYNYLNKFNNPDICPQVLLVVEIFEVVRDVFYEGRNGAKKLAFVMIQDRISNPIDKRFENEVEILQRENMDIQLMFIIIKADGFVVEESNFFLYISRSEQEQVKLFLGKLCSTCSPDKLSYTSLDGKNRKCYSLGNSTAMISAFDAMFGCEELYDLIKINSKEEFKYLRSLLFSHINKLNDSEVSVFIKLDAIDPLFFLAKQDNVYKQPYYNRFCAVWRFRSTQTNSTEVQFLMENRSTVPNVTSFTDQWLSVDCKEKMNSLKLCEIDLTLNTDHKSNRGDSVYSFSIKRVEEGNLTLLPTRYLDGLFNSNQFYFKGFNYEEENKYAQFSCHLGHNAEGFCHHILMCHSNDNYKNNFCNQQVQYIYNHKSFTEYFNHVVVKINEKKKNWQNTKYFNSSNNNGESPIPNWKMFKDYSFKFQDYPIYKENDITTCKRFNEKKLKTLNLSQVENLKLEEDDTFLSNTRFTHPSCFFSRSLAKECPFNIGHNNCSEVDCPSNFIKCPNSYCVFLGEELTSSSRKCYDLDTSKIKKKTTFQCSIQLKTRLKATCVGFKNLFYLLQLSCDFLCEDGFACFQGRRIETVGNQSWLNYDLFLKNIEISKIYDKYRIQPEEMPFLSLLDHAEIRASNCNIIDVYQTFQDLYISQLISFDLSFNNITSNDLNFISSIKILRYLNASYNPYLKIETKSKFPQFLQYLDLSYTNVDSIPQAAFDNLVYLKYLYLRHTKINKFNSIGLKPSFDLKIFDLRDTLLQQTKLNYFEGLTIQTALFVSDYQFCCPQVTGPHVPQDKCFSPKAPFLSSCQDLIGDSNKRIILWLVGLVAFVSNLLVVVYRLVWDREILKKAYGLFVICLGVSDLIMGLYLLVIAAADSYFRNLYVLNDTKWRHGNICKFAGFLATFSSESSAIFICLITIDRYLMMRYPFGEHRFTKFCKNGAVILTFFVSLLLALIPTFPLDWDIYSSNSMCLSLPLNTATHKGWQYSFCVLVVLNFSTFLFIFIGQVLVFHGFMKNKIPESSMIKKSRNNDLALAKNLAFVAVSDFLCWFPIAIMGFISLAGYTFGNEAYSWSAVLVIPINSALNPIIYTIPAITRKLRTIIAN